MEGTLTDHQHSEPLARDERGNNRYQAESPAFEASTDTTTF